MGVVYVQGLRKSPPNYESTGTVIPMAVCTRFIHQHFPSLRGVSDLTMLVYDDKGPHPETAIPIVVTHSPSTFNIKRWGWTHGTNLKRRMRGHFYWRARHGLDIIQCAAVPPFSTTKRTKRIFYVYFCPGAMNRDTFV